jgi:hypothetical protein
MGHAILSVELSVLAGAIYLPEQYKLLSAHYEPHTRLVKFLVESDALPEDKIDGVPLPTLMMAHKVDMHPDDHSFKKITGTAKIV